VARIYVLKSTNIIHKLPITNTVAVKGDIDRSIVLIHMSIPCKIPYTSEKATITQK
jgi:hypothetical protein